MRIRHIPAIILSGTIWFLIGVFLVFKGLLLTALCVGLVDSAGFQSPILSFLKYFVKSVDASAMLLVAISIAIGFAKAKFVLSKTVKRTVKRLLNKPSPLHLKDLFTPSYLILIGGMMCLGMALRFFPIYKDVKALIDIGVGSALVKGSLNYLKHAIALKAQTVKRK